VYAAVRSGVDPDLRANITTCRKIDLSAPNDFDAAMRDVDAVVHLAARVHMMSKPKLPGDQLADYRQFNTNATLDLASAAVRGGVSHFVFISTVKVNGERTTIRPFSDHDEPAPMDPYGISKCDAERGLAELANRTSLTVVTLRPPLVYGPAVKGNFLRLLKLVYLRFPLPLASVVNARSMIYVGNLASAIEHALGACPGPARSFLVSDDRDLSTPELIRMLGNAIHRPARLVPCPVRMLQMLGHALGKSDEVLRMIESLRVDCSGIKQQLNWVAPFTVEHGMRETAEWFVRTRSYA
jgi:nucleoside-diphosphate-sugar epimerase